MSQHKIADKVSVSKGPVQWSWTLQRFKETGSFSTRPRSGRPRVTTQWEDRYIKTTSLRNTIATADKIQALPNNTWEKPFSKKKKTVKRWLASNTLNGKVAVSKISARDCYGPRSTSIISLRTGKKFCLQINPKFSFMEIVDDFVSDAEVMKEC